MIFEALCAYAVYKGAKKVSAWNKKVVGNKKVIKAKKAKTNNLQRDKAARAAAGIMTGAVLLPLLPLLLIAGGKGNRKPRKKVAYEDMEFKGGSAFHL